VRPQIYTTMGRNFVLTILRLPTPRQELRIVCDQIGAPTWSREIAAGTVRILASLSRKGWSPDVIEPISGIYHMTAGGETSWHAFAEAILDESARSDQNSSWITAATQGSPRLLRRLIPIPTDEYPTAARRPAYSVLSNAKLRQTL